MPATGALAIELCTETGIAKAWIDADGAIHKSDPGKKAAADHPCAFAGLSAPLTGPDAVPMLAAPYAVSGISALSPFTVAVGRGLAAPPPWQTGPPTLA